jgi:hypothetical protein
MRELEGRKESGSRRGRKEGGIKKEAAGQTKCNVLRFCYSKCYGYLNTGQGWHSHKVCFGYNCLLPGELCGRSEELLSRSRN